MYSFILNPNAGRGRAAKVRPLIERYMEAAGVAFRVVETGSTVESVEASRREALRSDVVVSVGGDGSLHYVATGVIDARLTGASAALAVLPAGTGNDFARMAGMPNDFEQALDCILKGRKIAADHGWLIWDEQGVSIRRPFLNCAGVGLDAHSARLAARLKPYLGNSSYLVAPAIAVPLWKAPRARLAIAGPAGGPEDIWTGGLTLVSVTNGEWIGGGIHVSPGARIDDRALDLCLVPKVSIPRAYVLLSKAARGRHVDQPEVLMKPVLRVSVVTESPLPAYVDGEPVVDATTSVSFEIAAGEIPVVVNLET